MAKYIQEFTTETAYNTARTNNYIEPWTSLTDDSGDINYNKSEYEKLLSTPLTFKIQSAGDIKWEAKGTSYRVTLEYSKNGGEWTTITSNVSGSVPSISVVSGDIVQFRGSRSCSKDATSQFNYFNGSTCGFSLYGNIMSLVNSTNFATATQVSNYSFARLFTNCTGLTDASKLLLPATTIGTYGYSFLFYGCSNLTSAPQLPATTISGYCYRRMFQNCTSLINPPSTLPALTLAELCYEAMFRGCSSLTTAPEIYATILAEQCCFEMFKNCTSLTTAPELPATTLATECYKSMFDGCTSLNYIKCLATNTSASNCTYLWVYNVASSGTFIGDPNSTWTIGNNGIPSGWNYNNVNIMLT